MYSEFCSDYKTAFHNAKTACGDTIGNVQAMIDRMGTCNYIH